MAKVFRLYNIQGNNNIVDWEESAAYGTQAISEIIDPDGATATKEITSIPSPFARIDLVKTAFKEVTDVVRKSPNFERLPAEKVKELIEKGEQLHPTIYHKMVSEAFDVAEIFFNYDRFKENFEIIVWDKNKDLDTKNVFGHTLNRYLISDAQGEDPYNFGKMNRIYMLNYVGKGRPSSINIVGATSPATLFFSSANDLSYVSQNVAYGQDRPFDEDLKPLFRRDFEFQKYLFTFRKAYNNFASDFPELNAYLDITYRCLDNEKKNQIDSLNANSIDIYDPITIGEGGADTLEIHGYSFHKQPCGNTWKSDFEIRTNVYSESQKPLVLPIERGNTYENLIYTNDKWGNTNEAPSYDEQPWKTRRLPIVNNEYPYLTISDFLTDTIIRMPYELNADGFYDGGYKSKNNNDPYSYLLPLTDTFFKFFSVDDLQKEVVNGRKMFELMDNNNSVRAILRIPIQKGYIEYCRNYTEGISPNPKDNDGALVETKFGLGIMPLIRFPEKVQKHYRIAFFDKGKNTTSLSFKDGEKHVESYHIIRAEKAMNCSHEVYRVEDNFDRIKVDVGNGVEGYIIPKFKKETGTEKYTFAVDFGTTNTHIEYCTDSNSKKPNAFNILSSEIQLHKLHKQYFEGDIKNAFEQDFIPETIGDKDVYSFPMRTVFAQSLKTDYDQTPMPLCEGNIPFLYERATTPNWNVIKTELKWGGVPDRLLEMHLETLFILMRNKVMLNNGNLAATKVIWFYPASMTRAKVDKFKRIWKDAYEKYFGEDSNSNIISISESKAPYLHFINSQGAADEIVTIDIGGGTTDVFVVEQQNDKMLMSFRFASNAIFGDGYNSNPSRNGFVCKYKDALKDILEKNGLKELQEALNQVESQQKSSDIVAFLFSLVGEKVNNNRELYFLGRLSNDDQMRYVFILFYGAILYFIANTMKIKGLQKPKTLAFSGNGAKTLCILSDENETVASFAKLIFDGVYNDNKGSIEVMMEKNPKIATCKGGIEDPRPQPYDNINNIKTICVGNDFTADSVKKLTYADITDDI
ncbi:MAG: hypothetical protein J5606_03370, partial [Bacteroidales bacterium]|nr:hypothetical protein [Bacteroidales bacterium]